MSKQPTPLFQPGDSVPPFRFVADDGKTYSLESLRGKKVVLYFYPKDDTPGCTKEACSFRDNMARLEPLGVVVIGLSPDSADSHHAFRKKYNLPFALVPGVDEALATPFGAWGEKNLYGRISTGILRTTLVIDEQGKIIRYYPNVRVEGHVEDVMKAISE